MAVAVQEFERAAIRTLCSGVLPQDVLDRVLNHPEQVRVTFSGAGYYLELTHNDLPVERVVCDVPSLTGKLESTELGFVAFIEEHVLCLECYGYGEQLVTEEVRNCTVELNAA